MRVISGSLKGRVINNYHIVGTRPTMDRVKESIFATLGAKVKDSVVLDLFCGSGSLGIEALSNGCKYCYFNDSNKIVISKLNEILHLFKIDNVSKTMCLDYKKSLVYFKHNKICFDIVLLDPPYKDLIINDVLSILDSYKLLNNNAIVICEYRINTNYPSDRYELVKNKKYGDKYVNIYKYHKEV